MARPVLPWIVAAAVIAADQAAKAAVVARLTPAESCPLIPRILHLTYVQNTGMAFGLFRGYPLFFALLAVVVSIWIVTELARPANPDALLAFSLAAILGGALGNLIDRLRLGYVIDFIDLRVWPVFNVADSAITIGVALLLIHALFPSRRRG